MKFAVVQNGVNAARDRVADSIVNTLVCRGHTPASVEDGVKFVLNLTDTKDPKPFHRKHHSMFVVSLVVLDAPTEDLRTVMYTTLVRTFSNLVLCVARFNGCRAALVGDSDVFFMTPEVGFYHYPVAYDKICNTILPIVGSRFVLGNRFSTDLPRKYWKPSPAVENLKIYGRELGSLDLLIKPFPMDAVLSKQDIDHLYRVFGITGLSWGNLSVREQISALGKDTFWMSASGVNKGDLRSIGRDIMLVKGYDEHKLEILVSVPPDYNTKARVSVDAVEHFLIYRTFPKVGAIVHVHGWMDDILCTEQNFPCGTLELAEAVLSLLKRSEHPERTAIGLKNHGITITGTSLKEIFNRTIGKIKTTVPMFE